MASLTLASKANQATLLPPLLVATHANNLDLNVSIAIQFDDTEGLKQAMGAAAELSLGTDAPTCGSEDVVVKLVEAYPSLQRKNQIGVRADPAQLLCGSQAETRRSGNGWLEQVNTTLWTLRR